MQPQDTSNRWLFLRHNPLVPAAALFLAGVAFGDRWYGSPAIPLAISAVCLLAWLTAELILSGQRRQCLAHLALALALLFAGAALWQFNQHAVETTHLARFLSDDQPAPITARLRVLTPPEDTTGHGNLTWIATATEIFTDRGWIPSAGDVRVKWRSGSTLQLHRGDLVEIYGWLQRPDPALNPGGMNLQQLLAADRLFAEIRIPRAAGVVPLTDEAPANWPTLTRLRITLRAKLLQHTAHIDPEAAHSMAALLLGHRDPTIESVSQSFADAGVSHLLAISGTHVVFFTGLVWVLLRFIPMRPRWHATLLVLAVLAYVLATPCGPPVVRASVALLMVLISRLIGRPRQHLNMLAVAVIIVIVHRPADLFDAGFQLSFICTACLILFSERFFALLFHQWMHKQEMIADLAGTRWARFKFRAAESLRVLVSVNIIGCVVAAPLLAFHFGRINPHAIFTGLIALPIVALTMAASAFQLFLELVSTSLAALTAPLLTCIAHVMVWIIEHLAALPGASVALRAPPAWLIALLYLVILLWAMRRWLNLRRAILINSAFALLVTAAAWYYLTQPGGGLTLTALTANQGSSVLIRTPDGQLLLINAGSRDAPGLVHRAIAPALQAAGAKTLDAFLITAFDNLSASSAAEVIERFHPPLILTSAAQWKSAGATFAAIAIEDILHSRHQHPTNLAAGSTLDRGARLRILWPNDPPANPTALILLLEYAHKKILLLDPANPYPLSLLQSANLQVDAILFLGPQHPYDTQLRKLAAALGATTLLWNGRTPRTPHALPPNERNAADHSQTLRITADGILTLN